MRFTHRQSRRLKMTAMCSVASSVGQCLASVVSTVFLGLMFASVAQAQGAYFMNTNSSADVTIVVLDTFGNPIPSQPLSVQIISDVASGGHQHPVNLGGVVFRLGTVTPTTCNTGLTADFCHVHLTSGATGGTMNVQGTVTSGPNQGFVGTIEVNVGAFGGFDLGTKLDQYSNGAFTLIGQTAIHPDNHYCQPGVCQNAANLASQYQAQWGLILAYNDASLVRGGRFDISGQFQPPHSEHQTGQNIDVRANGAANSIPNDPTIRDWFTLKVQEIFGQPPLHESPGTSNEHYHIRG